MSEKDNDPHAEARKRHAAKRQRLAELMNHALAFSYDQALDPAVIEWNLGRGRGQRYDPDSRDFRSLPEPHLDYLIDYYGGSGRTCVW